MIIDLLTERNIVEEKEKIINCTTHCTPSLLHCQLKLSGSIMIEFNSIQSYAHVYLNFATLYLNLYTFNMNMRIEFSFLLEQLLIIVHLACVILRLIDSFNSCWMWLAIVWPAL